MSVELHLMFCYVEALFVVSTLSEYSDFVLQYLAVVLHSVNSRVRSENVSEIV